jgi:predicted transcriptional regulator YdeE
MSDITDPQVIEYRGTRKSHITDPQEIEAAKNKLLNTTDALDKALTKIPAATWAVFTFDTELTEHSLSEAYTRILTEWMPISGYKRDESAPHMERYEKDGKTWEIWIPVINK